MTMTNNPTIDGVSREPEVFMRTFEIRKQMPVDTCHILGAPVTASSFVDREVVLLDDHRERIAALQSTIARLEARVTQLESEAMYAAAGYQAARDRIAELESGRGEPVAWVAQCKSSGLVEQAEPNEKASNPAHWSDSFPVYRHPAALPPTTIQTDSKGPLLKFINDGWRKLSTAADGTVATVKDDSGFKRISADWRETCDCTTVHEKRCGRCSAKPVGLDARRYQWLRKDGNADRIVGFVALIDNSDEALDALIDEHMQLDATAAPNK